MAGSGGARNESLAPSVQSLFERRAPTVCCAASSGPSTISLCAEKRTRSFPRYLFARTSCWSERKGERGCLRETSNKSGTQRRAFIVVILSLSFSRFPSVSSEFNRDPFWHRFRAAIASSTVEKGEAKVVRWREGSRWIDSLGFGRGETNRRGGRERVGTQVSVQ